MGFLFHPVPKVFFLVGLTTLGTFDLLVHKLSVQPLIVSTILCTINGDVQQFISHCLIPLDPRRKVLFSYAQLLYVDIFMNMF